MSASEVAARARFSMQVDVDPGRTLDSLDVQVRIYDSANRLVLDGRGSVQVELPRGIYTVRAEFGSQWVDQVVRHAAAGTRVEIALPKRPSPVPFEGSAGPLEAYAEAAQRLSAKTTAPPLKKGAGAGMFLFLRAEHAESYRGEWLWEDLRLLNADGRRLTSFGPSAGEFDKIKGYYGYSVEAAPGLYLLEAKGPVPRVVPVYVFEGWQTQVFVSYRQRPLLESATMLMSRWENGFDPGDRTADAIDMALRGLQSEVEAFPREALNILLAGKFDNPMLGLLGAHVLLRRREIDPYLLETVLHNLNHLLPGSPDVSALAWMLLDRTDLQVDFGLPSGPPMMRAALEALFDLSSRGGEYAGLIPGGSLMETIAGRRYIDSVFSSWKPLRRVRSTPGAGPPVETWVLEFLKKQRLAASAAGTQVDLRDAARRLNLPLTAIETAWKQLN